VSVTLLPAEAPRARVLLAESAVAALAALIAVTLHLRLWRARWNEPFALGGDASFYLMEVRSLGRFGTYLSSPNLGWPFGQSVHDLPQGVDNFHWLILKVLYALSGTTGGAVNLFYVLSSCAVAAMTMIVMRMFGVRRWLALVMTLLFVFLPYHFARGEGHILLSGYQLVPLGVLLAASLFGDHPPLVRRNDAGRSRIDWSSRRTWLVMAACVGLASTGAYYMMFSLGLVVIAALLSATTNQRGNRAAPLMAAAVIVVVTGFVFALNVSPTILYLAKNGANAGVASRSPSETELYGLRISQLFLPREQHRIGPLSKIATRSQGKVVPSEGGQQLGIIGAAGLAALLGSVVLAAMGKRLRQPFDVLNRLGLLTLACILAGTVSGFAVFISAAGMSYIRAWNRISVVIGFMALLAVGLLLEHLLQRRPAVSWLAPVLAVGSLGVGYIDQTSPFDVPPYDAIHTQAKSETAFYQSVATTAGAEGTVFTWPHVPFPEVPDRGGTGAYDQALGYVFQPNLKWSFGFTRGRHPDYPLAFEKQPANQWLTSVVAIGFRTLVVDRAALKGINSVPDVEPDVRTQLGEPVTVSADGRYALYDLHAFAAKAESSQGADALKSLASRVLAGA
jgi:phosphoglycerol transferase